MAGLERSESTGIVAIFAVMVLVLIAGFIAWRASAFGAGDRPSLEIHVDTPARE